MPSDNEEIVVGEYRANLIVNQPQIEWMNHLLKPKLKKWVPSPPQ